MNHVKKNLKGCSVETVRNRYLATAMPTDHQHSKLFCLQPTINSAVKNWMCSPLSTVSCQSKDKLQKKKGTDAERH